MLDPNKPVHIFSVGALGQATAGYLRKLRQDVTETAVVNNVVPLPETWPASRINVLASWKPAPSLCQLLEEITFSSFCPFVPLMVDSTVLRLGPVVLPGEGCCWSCWVKRWKQHSESPEAHSALLGYYAAHPEAGAQGFLEPFAVIAASRLAETIEDLDASLTAGGSIWQMDLLTREIVTSVAVGVHNCPRCGLHREAANLSYTGLEKDLAYLWEQARAKGNDPV